MYDHADYKDHTPEAIHQFIAAHPLALLSGCNKKFDPVATQVPVLLEKEADGSLYLRGHMIRGSEHHKAFQENPKVMLVFTGPQSYVSATWYAKERSASTWNFMSVQAKGSIRFLGEAGLRAIMQKTTLHFEKGNHHSPTVFRNLDPQYVQRLLKYIIAFEVKVESLDHVFKLSQDMDAGSYQSIVAHLHKGDANAQMVATEMEKRMPGLFGEL
ncbi:FMN-binding negative transcriptional regulator [Robertkochia sediminum]|uniref:FMN-binding negative transcriptional regulator n=1 Tax=Robertkochia sediminum TaxID=2785326 RepID=UPI0019342FC9|nr:FMN-binding negative transcriptional regulator [Robertkochia sediminum]MBL7472375.1 FMN-binding negative transcriptional regulator [Robertkochia sediminum]